jgi:hypothetical protein
MKFLITGLLGSTGRRHLYWLGAGGQSLWAFTGILGPRFADGAAGKVRLDYNQRPAAHQPGVVDSQGTGRRICWEPGVQ